MTLNIIMKFNQPHWWCNRWGSPLKFCRPWVPVPIYICSQAKDYEIYFCCIHVSAINGAELAALMSKSKDLLVWDQGNVSEWSDMSTHELLFQ